MIGFTVPLKKEAESLIEVLENRSCQNSTGHEIWTGRIADTDVALCVTGHGKIMSASGTRQLIEKHSPRVVIHFGTCGALSKELNIGDIVLGREIVEHDYHEKFDPKDAFPKTESCNRLLELFGNFLSNKNVTFHTGIMLSGTEDIVTTERRDELYHQFKGVSCDWETMASAVVCEVSNLPFLAVRSVSDYAYEHTVSEFDQNAIKVSANLAALFHEFVAVLGSEIDPTEKKRIKLPTDAGYDRWAEIYDAEHNSLIALEEAAIPDSFFRGFQNQSVIDLGCGTGRNTFRIAKFADEVIGVDFSQGMLSEARKKSANYENIKFSQHDLGETFPFADNSFDGVFSSLVLEHIKDLSHFFNEVGRVCKSGGDIVLTTMHPAMFLRNKQAHFHDENERMKISFDSFPHQVGDFVNAALSAELTCTNIDERFGGSDFGAEKNAGWPMLLIMHLRKGRK